MSHKTKMLTTKETSIFLIPSHNMFIFLNQIRWWKLPYSKWRTALRDFSLNWIILFSQPIGVEELNNHINSTWARTWDCTKMEAWKHTRVIIHNNRSIHIQNNQNTVRQTLELSTPHARYIAAVLLVALESCGASYGKVIYKYFEQSGKHNLTNLKEQQNEPKTTISFQKSIMK